MSVPNSEVRRFDIDVMKLIQNKYEVTLINGLNEFHVKFHGPRDTPYEGGIWKVRVLLPDQYPFKSPSIGFINKIWHPNIEEAYGSVCLNVINETWSPLFDLVTIFENFLPQLLTYPNPEDPMNVLAAIMLLNHPDEYKAKVVEYVRKFASDNIPATADQDSVADKTVSNASSLSDLSLNEDDA